MAQWKKIIVSGSDAELNNITGSNLQLTGVPHSSDVTPLVIDANGNVSTGSAYALASGGDTVGGSNLDSNIVIIGDGASQIQTASSAQNADFNSADITGVSDITASNAIFTNLILSSSGHAISSTVLTHSSSLGTSTTQSFLEVPSGLDGLVIKTNVTMSDVPLVSSIDHTLGIDTNGEIVQIKGGNTSGGGNAGVSGLTVCDDGNINLSAQTGSTTTSFEFVADKGNIVNNTSQILVQNGDFSNFNPGDTIQIRATYQDVEKTLDTTVLAIKATGGSDGAPGGSTTYAVSSSMSIADNWAHDPGFSSTGGASVYRRIEGSNTGIVEICLDDDLLLNSITASAGILFSGSGTSNIFEIGYNSSAGELNISASNLEVSGNVNVGGVMSFDGFTFSDGDVLLTSGSTVFGSGSGNTHQFTGSLTISGGLSLDDGTLAIPGFSDVSSSLVTLFLASGSTSGISSSYTTLSASYSTLSGSHSSVSSSYSTLSASYATLSGSYPGVSSSIAGISGSYPALSASYAALSGSYPGVSSSIAGISGSYPALSSSYATLSASYSTLSGSTEGNTSLSASIATAMSFNSDNVTIKGDLIVNGSTTTINTTNLHVEDRFILLGSGSSAAANLDVGIIFDSGSLDGNGMALFYNNSSNRLSVGKGVNDSYMSVTAGGRKIGEEGGTTDDGTLGGDIMTITSGSVVPGTTPAEFGQGEMRIDDSNDVWIYID